MNNKKLKSFCKKELTEYYGKFFNVKYLNINEMASDMAMNINERLDELFETKKKIRVNDLLVFEDCSLKDYYYPHWQKLCNDGHHMVDEITLDIVKEIEDTFICNMKDFLIKMEMFDTKKNIIIKIQKSSFDESKSDSE